eukprot:scaffold244927_cov35-Tisochrysis_lutea.AAC.1
MVKVVVVDRGEGRSRPLSYTRRGSLHVSLRVSAWCKYREQRRCPLCCYFISLRCRAKQCLSMYMYLARAAS